MLTAEQEQDIIILFNQIIDAYVSSASDAVVADIAFEDTDIDDVYDEPEYKYEISRITTVTEEWKKELFGILDGNTR